ncbi:MAG: Crp/Fnr family transcriptional regulator [Cyclobacteriaceae bacterium]
MNTEPILNSILKHIHLTDAEKKYFVSMLLPIHQKQGELIEKSGEASAAMIYVHSGCLMTYYSDPNGSDRVVQFAPTGWWTGDLHSIDTGQPSIYSTKALVESEAFLLPKEKITELLVKVAAFEKYFRILYQKSLVTHQHRIIQAFSFTAEQRYAHFREKYPALEQYVPLKYIASYLGITPEFLSKIRRKQLEK